MRRYFFANLLAAATTFAAVTLPNGYYTVREAASLGAFYGAVAEHVEARSGIVKLYEVDAAGKFVRGHGMGTGVLAKKEGKRYLATAQHVIDADQKPGPGNVLKVEFHTPPLDSGSVLFQVTTLASHFRSNPEKDIALLDLSTVVADLDRYPDELFFTILDSTTIETATPLISLGYKYDLTGDQDPIVSFGNLLSKEEPVPSSAGATAYRRIARTTMVGIPGISGGPVVALDPKGAILGLIGLNRSISGAAFNWIQLNDGGYYPLSNFDVHLLMSNFFFVRSDKVEVGSSLEFPLDKRMPCSKLVLRFLLGEVEPDGCTPDADGFKKYRTRVLEKRESVVNAITAHVSGMAANLKNDPTDPSAVRESVRAFQTSMKAILLDDFNVSSIDFFEPKELFVFNLPWLSDEEIQAFELLTPDGLEYTSQLTVSVRQVVDYFRHVEDLSDHLFGKGSSKLSFFGFKDDLTGDDLREFWFYKPVRVELF